MKPSLSLLAGLAGVCLFSTSISAAPTTWAIDPDHSAVQFRVRHLFTPVPGKFAIQEGEIVFDPAALESSRVRAVVSVSSVNTGNEKRDHHLQTDDFFSAAKYPTATFTSTRWISAGENQYTIEGKLELMGKAFPVSLQTTYLGSGPGMKPGEVVSGWEATTKLSRKDLGVTYGAGLVGDEVSLTLTVEAKQRP